MLLHTLPPRLMYLVMAIRAASIWRLLTQAASAACRPNSPKVTLVPPLASPPLRGRCCLRCFTRLGVNMARSPLPLLGGAGVRRSGRRLGRCRGRLGGRPWLRPRPAAVGTGAPVRTAAAAVAAPATTTLTGARAGARPLGLLLLAGGQHVAPVDPDLHADLAEGGAALGQAVVDVGPQGVQGHAALAVPLGAGHLGAATPCATSCASVSAPLTSRMFRVTCLCVILSRSARIWSASAPRRPMTTPGRAVWMSTRTRSRVRSISTLEMPACVRRRLRYLRMAMSSCR